MQLWILGCLQRACSLTCHRLTLQQKSQRWVRQLLQQLPRLTLCLSRCQMSLSCWSPTLRCQLLLSQRIWSPQLLSRLA